MRSPRAHRLTALACTVALLAMARPAAADPPAAPAALRNPALLAGGVVLAVAGSAAMTLGVVRIAASEACPDACSNPKGNELIGGVVLGVGAAALAGGIVMAVIGGKREPAAGAAAWVGEPGGAGWRWRF